MKRPMKRILRITGIVTATLAILVVAFGLLSQRSKPELSLWHTVNLKEEFQASDADDDFSWADYLAAENALFDELDERIVQPSGTDADPDWNRYAEGGVNNPAGFPINWNRSFELPTSNPVGGALLIHGLTDSPYSMRRTAEILHSQGFSVVGLRLPGHGTAPSMLAHAEVKDWVAAVRIAYRHLLTTIDRGAPVIVAGYSNGAALSLDLTLDTLEDEDLRTPNQIVLFSPAIGITRAAVLARTPNLLSWMPWFSKLGWSDIEPEFDPFKYSSFPTDSGYQTHVLTRSIRARLARLGDGADGFPPVLAFMSLADATVLVEAVVSGLFDRLTKPENELVVFDINRLARMREFFRTDPAGRLRSLTERETTPYRVTVISTLDETSNMLDEWSRPGGAAEPVITDLELAWPPGFYSLSHVAIPFPPDDPVYGFVPNPDESYGIPLGMLEPRGEKGLLSIPAGQFNRLRSNPFFPYIEQRLIELTGHPATREDHTPSESTIGRSTES